MTRPLAWAVLTATLALLGATALPESSSRQNPQGQPAPQLPTFRTEAHFVRVDVYPSRNGHIVEGLTAGDFEVFEDGKPQKIDTFQFVKFPSWTPEGERRDPSSQRDMLDLAADPQYRLFVIYLDMYHVGVSGSYATRQPLVNMLNRMLGPRDLFGVLTPRQSPSELVLGQRTETIEEQLTSHWTWGNLGRIEPADPQQQADPDDVALELCRLQGLIPRRRLDKVFSDLEGLVAQLDGMRQERKNIVLFSGGWNLPPPASLSNQGSKDYVMPPIGVTNEGKLTMGGRPGETDTMKCETLRNRLVNIDFQQRHRNLLRAARTANVAFYPVNPQGLEAPVTTEGMTASRERVDRLLELADNTDGVAIVNTNDLDSGLKRVASDLEAYYVLGYYTTNTKWDGALRKIAVRLKPSGATVRARHEYRAPTEGEMATMRAAKSPAAPTGPSPVDTAPGELGRLAPSALLLTRGAAVGRELSIIAEIAAAPIEAGRWKNGADIQAIISNEAGETVGTGRGHIEAGTRSTLVHVPVAGQTGPWHAVVQMRASGDADQYDSLTIARMDQGLLGQPIVFRGAPATASPLRPVGALQFRRTERIHADWPVLKPLDRRDARLLGRDGQPLAIDVTVAERASGDTPMLSLDLSLAALAAGDYVLEITAGAGATTERTLLALRVVR